MRLTVNTIRDQQNSVTPIFSNIANRINYLQQKNQSVNKKLLAYMNCFERRLLSQRSHNSESKDKNSPTFRIHPVKKIPIKEDTGRFQSENTQLSKGPKLVQRNYKTESESKQKFIKNINNLKAQKGIGFQLNEMKQNNKESDNVLVPLESLKKRKRFMQQVENKNPFNHSLANDKEHKFAPKTDNFLKTHSKKNEKKSPYTQILKCLGHRKDGKKGDQQKLKLIEIKKKLLEEQEKSLMEYEKCILYKQKLAQKIKHQNFSQGNTGSEIKKNFEQSEVFIYANDNDS